MKDEDEGDLKPSLLASDDPVLKVFQDTHFEDFQKITQVFEDPLAVKIMIEAFHDYDDNGEFQNIPNTNSGATLSMFDAGCFSLNAFRNFQRPLPLVSGLVDSSPSARKVSVTFGHLTIHAEKEVAKGFEISNGGSLLTQK